MSLTRRHFLPAGPALLLGMPAAHASEGLSPAEEARVVALLERAVAASPEGGPALARLVQNLLTETPAAAAVVLNHASGEGLSAGAVAAIASGFNGALVTLAASDPTGAAALGTLRATAAPMVQAALLTTAPAGALPGLVPAVPAGALPSAASAGFGGVVTPS
jgi:hypothetical protein